MNPPYSRGNIDKFVKKAYEESQKGCTVVGLLPLRSASWFHKYVMKAHEIRFLTRRVKFIDPETGKPSKGSPNFDSIIVVWKPGHVDAPKVSSYEW
jgi:site-specific DNA-methyltransferase (adenine-specific)